MNRIDPLPGVKEMSTVKWNHYIKHYDAAASERLIFSDNQIKT